MTTVLHLVGVVFVVLAGLPQGDEAALDRVYRSASYQRELPPSRSPDLARPSRSGGPRQTRLGGGGGAGGGARPPSGSNGTPPPATAHVFGGGAEFGVFALWTLAVLGGAYVVWQITRALMDFARRTRSRSAGATEATDAASDPLAEGLVPDHEALAGAGRFAEAIHALLLEACADLGLRTTLPPALTAREIRGVAPLAPEGRRAFAGLVEAVELSRYGRRPVTAAMYATCVAHRRGVVAVP